MLTYKAIGRQFPHNDTVNLILMLVAILFVIALGKLIGIIDYLSEPPQYGTSLQDQSAMESPIGIVSNVLLFLQIGLLILLAYCGFATGRNYSMRDNENIND